MKGININKEDFNNSIPDLEDVSVRMDMKSAEYLIDTINWGKYNYKPQVKFKIAYSDNEIFIKYYVQEEYLKAEKTKTNQMVCEDSCVEFFVSPANDGIYYNIEFNAIGTCLMGSGTCRDENTLAESSIISKIRRKTSVGEEPFAEIKGNFSWELTAAIPYEVFSHHNVSNLKGETFKANFYKCGDKLSFPHYLTWNPVGTAKPDYHQPRYFGKIKFI
jgi:hypothetical protein